MSPMILISKQKCFRDIARRIASVLGAYFLYCICTHIVLPICLPNFGLVARVTGLIASARVRERQGGIPESAQRVIEDIGLDLEGTTAEPLRQQNNNNKSPK